jgi:3-methylfumaryl-CoA hydratase
MNDLDFGVAGGTESRRDVVSEVSAAALHGLFDVIGTPPALHDPLPPLWHWLAFLPNAPQRELGPDGHPSEGTLLFTPPGMRRMFAGATVEFLSPIGIGETIHRTSEVTAVTKKQGKSGALLFAEVTHHLSVGDRLTIREVQNLVYRGPSRESVGSTRDGGVDLVEEDWGWRRELPTDSVLLFRFCALTYNAHRIHYDREYATTVEGYPGLVVPGPLLAIALALLALEANEGSPIATFEFRAIQPIYEGDVVQLRGRRVSADSLELAAFNAVGQLSMTASAGMGER